MTLEQLKYPIGKFETPHHITNELLNKWMLVISSFPQTLKNEVSQLTDAQLDTIYRPNGWTIRQVIHHCADSHMNAFTRLKLALTEDSPSIKPYLEHLWAELPDAQFMPIEPSLKMLEGIHERWSALLKQLSEEQLKRVFIHPEHGKEIRVNENMGMYAWHCEHHLAHITGTINRNNWR
jgi:hypothetical protein